MVPLAIKQFGRRVALRLAAPSASLLVRMPDGRSIAVEEYGDPLGPVVLYFHGWPASRLEAAVIQDLPVRLLAMDRPGYGGSTPHPGRTLRDWAVDVAYVADRLGLRQFHVVGLSGGGPYAAACAHAMPDRVLGLALVSPVPPPDLVPDRGTGIGHLLRLGRHPHLARRLFTVARPLLRRRLITPQTVVRSDLPANDRSVLSRAVMGGLARAWREGFRRGVEGALSDAHVYAHDWGFSLDGVRVPSSLWIGTGDTLIPLATLEPYRAIPGIRWHVLPGEGHYSLAILHVASILQELTGPEAPAVCQPATAQLSSSLSQYR